MFQLFVPLTQLVLQFLSPPFEFFNRLLIVCQLAAEFLALLPQVAQLRFKSLAPLSLLPADGFRLLRCCFRRGQLFTQLRLQARSLSGLLFQPGFGAIQFFGHLPQAGLQHHTVLLALGSRLLRQRQLAGEIVALLLPTCQVLLKLDAPRVFFTANCFPLFARLGLHRFHGLPSLVRRQLLKARFELLSLCTLLFQLDSGPFQFFGHLPQAGFRCCAVLLGFRSRLLRQRQLTAEFVVLLLQTGQFLFKSNAPRAFFKASRFRGIPLFGRLGLHRFRFHDLASLVRRHLLKARFDLLSLCTLMLQGGPNLLQFRSISKNARSQFLALLLLLFERFAQSGSLSRHGL